MKILVIGAGAVGGYFGGRLAEAGRDVTFLVREQRTAQLRRTGLRLHSPHGDAFLKPALLTAQQLREHPQPFDIVLISTKSYSLEAAMADVIPAIGPRTAIIPLLNGMAHIDLLRARFGAERVFGGSVRIIADVNAQGEIVQQTELGEISFGLLPEQGTAHGFDPAAIAAELTAPKMITLLQPAMLATLWQKWWILASMNGICVGAGGSLGQALRQPYGEAFCRGVLDECTAIATANGYPPDPRFLAEHLRRLTDGASTLTTSMYRDMTRGLPVEADHVFGDLLARAKGVAAPRVEAAYVRSKVYEASRLP